MSGETLYQAPRRHRVSKMRVHDYLYDSAYIVSGARDYARTAFRAAMTSAQICIQPVYKTMFSELRKFPRMQVVYHPNCRLPGHIDRSYGAYVERVREPRTQPAPELGGKDRFKFTAFPKKVLALSSTSPDFHPPTPRFEPVEPTRPRNRATQSLFRESSAQTHPWQPDGRPAGACETTPEVMYLDRLEWGPGMPYRVGDLPADFHTTEIINKMRHARTWMDVVEKAKFPRWMKKGNEIITEVETKDWIFREAEIDELQEIRLALLHKLQAEQRTKQTSRTGRKLAKLWARKKKEMERKVEHIRHTRDRELRKLTALHGGGGRPGLVQRMRAARGGGSVTLAAGDPASDAHGPLARHGYQARRGHAEIVYDPSLLALEDHMKIAAPPAWLEQCGQNLTLSCSGHHLARDPTQLCERETKWSEQFLENLHNDLKKARLGAASATAGPLRVLRPRRAAATPRPATPEVEAVHDDDESCHQAALTLQRVIRGRAVQCLMYEGRTRAAELTEELKTTHGLQREDKLRIAKEEDKAREYNANRTRSEQKEDAISALVDELCGSAVASALDFLEKELKRLKEERRQHAFILIAVREKVMREAAEAGRRQKEEHRRREHDEMFKQILGVTQETVDAYLRDIVQDGIDLVCDEDATTRAQADAERIDLSLQEHASMSTAEQNELVAELVHQCLLPGAQRAAARLRVAAAQRAGLDAARGAIFGLLDDAAIRETVCTQCGRPLGEACRCRACAPRSPPAAATPHRDDPRWRATRARSPLRKEKTMGDRFPPEYDFRCLLDTLVDEAVLESRRGRSERGALGRELGERVRGRVEAALDARQLVGHVLDRATGALSPPPPRDPDYHHFMLRVVGDALARSEPFHRPPCPKELPSEARRAREQAQARPDPACRCEEEAAPKSRVQFGLATMSAEEKAKLLPSEIRYLEEMRRCKCDLAVAPSPATEEADESRTGDDTATTPPTPVETED